MGLNKNQILLFFCIKFVIGNFWSKSQLIEVPLNIYQLSHDVVEAISCGYISAGHIGFASVISATNSDDTLVYAFTNGGISLFAVMSR